jgi:ribonuclease E
MPKKMLIDATHAEETRVVVVDGNKVEEFDFESESKRQLTGNIYLAKVTRVEPSLQAAFIEYGGNRHGFLAFAEIHPDYYQIPVADREALLAEEEAEARAESERAEAKDAQRSEAEGEAEAAEEEEAEDEAAPEEIGGEAEIRGMETVDEPEGGLVEDVPEARRVEEPEAPRRPRQKAKRYKIQEVLKVRQILLVQVVKEERGNKGAALTTYLSLAGRYCVLMPNTARGGGISRKITQAADRKKLKEIASEIELPRGAGLIIRTAGAKQIGRASCRERV